MTNGTRKWLLAAGLTLNLSTAGATIILDTPTTLSINTVLNDNVVVDNRNASVIVGTGGMTGPVRVYQGALDVTGTGRVTGSIGLGGGTSTARFQDQATIFGEITSDSSLWWNDESRATVRLYLEDQSMVVGNVNYSGYLRIQDQAIVSGNVSNVVTGNIGIDMSGGLVTGMVYLGAGNSMTLNLDGGAILGGVRGIWGDLDLQMSGGTINGGLWTGAAVNAEISGGRINDGILIATQSTSNLRITGGQFDTALDNWLVQFTKEAGYPGAGQGGVLEIWGGQFGYADAGQGFLIDDLMNFSVYGRDLVYSNGWLTGYLMDGSWFSNALTFGSNWQGAFTIHNVPEPETLVLLLIGVAGMVFSRRSIKRASCEERL